jgi:mannose/cellobiose epimerase-like protein (N-acyl-D-glucosamine 2-epimerase family)
MSAPPRKTLLEPGHEAEWAQINREKCEYHQGQARALTPSERVAQGQKLSQQAVQLLASTIRRGHVSPRAFWS